MITLKINSGNAKDENGNALTFLEVKAAIERAVAVWNASPHSRATFEVDQVQYGPGQGNDNGVSTVTFAPLGYNGAAGVWYDANGIIDEVDLKFDRNVHWNTEVSYPSSYSLYTNPYTQYPMNYHSQLGPIDLEDIAAHELGHGVGLDHVASPYQSYTMAATDYTASDWWEKTSRRSLEEGDKSGKIYQAPQIPGSNSTQQVQDILLAAPSTVSLGGAFTIGSGKTFAVEPNRSLSFPTNSYLSNSGTLSATDATFAASSNAWDGIVYNSGSSGTLDGVTITIPNNSSDAVALTINNASPSIIDATIEVSGSNQQGIVISGVSAAPVFHHNRIFKAAGRETVYITGSASPYFYYNYLTNTSSGAVLLYSSSSSITRLKATAGGIGNNEFDGGGTGIRAYNGSIVYAGEGTSTSNNNHFCGQAYYHMSAGDTSIIDAKYNYFTPAGTPAVDVEAGSSIDTSPVNSGGATCSPNSAYTYIPPKNGDGVAGYVEFPQWKSGAESLFYSGMSAAESGKAAEAEELWKQLIAEFPESSFAFPAINALGEQFRMSQRVSILRFIQDISQSGNDALRYVALEVLSRCYEASGDYVSARTTVNRALEMSSRIGREFEAQSTAFFLELNMQGAVAAERVLAGMKANTADEERELKVMQWLAYVTKTERVSRNYSISEPDDNVAGLEDRVESIVVSAYPNPFNPVITFKYMLPRRSHVILTIYDALGREIVNPVNMYIDAGVHEAVFDASHFPSGSYFYSLITDEGIVSRMITLVK